MKRLWILPAVGVVLSGCNSGSGEPIPDVDETSEKKMEVEVVDYSPAPGQFVNVLPEWVAGMTADDMCRAVEASLKAGHDVTLGAWGGSLTVRLINPLVNRQGDNYFKVLGNAITTSAEPGLVYVMDDKNGNGKADDGEWLLIRPATFGLAEQVTTTYSSPTADATDENYIGWRCSDGSNGYLNRVSSYHSQPFFPCWIDGDELTFSGLRLPDNGHYDPESMMYILDPIGGTADSYPNSRIDGVLCLDNVIDKHGNRAEIAKVDFIKVVTGVLQANGPLGECSTEVCGFEKYVMQ
ncbi:MAG: hypothetical protein J1E84_03350 [Muribaculaceae bacterium]|nr:hypothetical protein [Muribaculaceae bacterium]